MRYSIIIPTLNEEKLLPKLLDQLTIPELKEKFDLEIIVSDGGSKDATVEIAKRYTDKVLIHRGEKRQTIAEGRNEGAIRASGDVLIFLDGDILFKNVLSFFEKVDAVFYEGKYLAMTCYVEIHPNERTFSDIIFLGFYNRYFRLLNNIGVGMGRGECQIIPKEIFDSVGGYNKNLVAGEDFDLFKRIRKKGKILFDKDLIIYESPRRYRKYGHAKIFFAWLFNALSVIFANKSVSTEWEEIR